MYISFKISFVPQIFSNLTNFQNTLVSRIIFSLEILVVTSCIYGVYFRILMKKVINAYLRHIRKQPEYDQRVHAFSISGLLTVIILVLWLHFHYGFWSYGGEEVYSKDQSYEIRDLSKDGNVMGEDGVAKPKEVFKNFFEDIRERVNSVPFSFSGIISDTKTFERQE